LLPFASSHFTTSSSCSASGRDLGVDAGLRARTAAFALDGFAFAATTDLVDLAAVRFIVVPEIQQRSP
jgi:hypothetical protein